MPRIINGTALVSFAAVAVLAASPALAGPERSRGNILKVDWNAMQMELKDPKGNIETWKVAKDATVKFSVQSWQNRSAKIQDLRPGMYIHFTFEGMTRVIADVDVREIEKAAAEEPATPAVSAARTGRVTAVDLRTAQVEVILDQGGRKTFQAANATVLSGLKAGDRVGLVTEPREGQDVVTEVLRGGSVLPRR